MTGCYLQQYLISQISLMSQYFNPISSADNISLNLIYIWALSVCLSEYAYYGFCHKCDTLQYLSQIKSDCHKTFSVYWYWSLELINNVHLRANESMHLQGMKTWTIFGQGDTPQFLSQMNSDFDETWFDLWVGIEDAVKKIGSDTCMHAHIMHVNMHACFNNQ